MFTLFIENLSSLSGKQPEMILKGGLDRNFADVRADRKLKNYSQKRLIEAEF